MQYRAVPKYIKGVMSLKSRWELARFRTSSHLLRVEVDRHQTHHPPRELRTCRLCASGQVEDEHHIIFDCTYHRFVQLRDDYSSLFQDASSLHAFLDQAPRRVAAFVSQIYWAGDFKAMYKHFRRHGAHITPIPS
jgi:hypothetical protein